MHEAADITLTQFCDELIHCKVAIASDDMGGKRKLLMVKAAIIERAETCQVGHGQIDLKFRGCFRVCEGHVALRQNACFPDVGIELVEIPVISPQVAPHVQRKRLLVSLKSLELLEHAAHVLSAAPHIEVYPLPRYW